MGADFGIVIRFWGALFFAGIAAYPLTAFLFPTWYDRGYSLSKAVGMAAITYGVYLFGITHLVPFTIWSVYIAAAVVFAFGLLLHWLSKLKHSRRKASRKADSVSRGIRMQTGIRFALSELCFFAALLLWSWVKGHEASVHGLEKFMDYGFMQSILNSRWFPAPDMWYTPFPINYYYFGHTVVAVLTRMSGIGLNYTFNLMLAALFAFTLTMSYSIANQLLILGFGRAIGRVGRFLGSVVTAYIITLGGNLQTIYAFTKGYTGEDVKPFWTLFWSVKEFWNRLPEGLERYWYANATRFIPFTIHEFPSYSFVVSDVHGHVMSLPFTLLAIALLIQIFGGKSAHEDVVRAASRTKAIYTPKSSAIIPYMFYGLIVSVLLMTNALDGPIYLGIFLLLFMFDHVRPDVSSFAWWKDRVLGAIPVITASVAASVPFMYYFKSFVSGVAVNCPVPCLANTSFGPLLFEGVEKCQRSPIWMMLLLWGFFLYWGIFFIGILLRKFKSNVSSTKIAPHESLLAVFFIFSVLLIVFPEFFYFKDIYPAHFRSNTMFKLGYQAFLMFGFVTGYAMVKAVEYSKSAADAAGRRIIRFVIALSIPLLFLVSIYPIFSVRSYFNSLRVYSGLDGTAWLKQQYPDDYDAIMWLLHKYEQRELTDDEGRVFDRAPVIVEADGDSYTDFARYSAFTGFPSVIGWPVHEWLWRGTYDVVAPRREDVRIIYESEDSNATRAVLSAYNVSFIIVSAFEREKFTNLAYTKLDQIASVVYARGNAVIYRVNRQE